jgi:hypothetical protein
MTEDQWRARVAKAWEPLARGFAAYPLDEDSIAPLRGLCRELDAALFQGFALYANLRPSAPINLEELDL